MADDYTRLEGYNPDADLGLGCGLPTEFAKIKAGDTVVDLGAAQAMMLLLPGVLLENGVVLSVSTSLKK